MITRQELEGRWDELKGSLQKRWGQLTDDELQEAKGSSTELVGAIERKTGETRAEIEDFLENFLASGESVVRQAMDTASEYAGQASEAVRDQYDHLAENFRAGYERAGEMVRRSPVESVAVAFGAGIITGVVVGLVLNRR